MSRCESCDYRTGDHNSLRRHVMRHEGRRPYRCPLCPYATIQSCHFKVSRPPDCVRMLTTTICPPSNTPPHPPTHHNPRLFQTHVLSKHPTESERIVFSCRECTFRSVSSESYFAHVGSHRRKEAQDRENEAKAKAVEEKVQKIKEKKTYPQELTLLQLQVSGSPFFPFQFS